jgi:hypothetical protein
MRTILYLLSLCNLIFFPIKSFAQPVVPQFRSGTLSTSSSSETLINETITSYQFSGFSYTSTGNNVKPIEGSAINPNLQLTETQTANGVNYNWVTPSLEAVPQFQIVNEAQPFSLVTSVKNPGLDTITIIQRQIQTSTQSTSESVFGM